MPCQRPLNGGLDKVNNDVHRNKQSVISIFESAVDSRFLCQVAVANKAQLIRGNSTIFIVAAS